MRGQKWRYAVRKPKIGRYAVRKGDGGLPSVRLENRQMGRPLFGPVQVSVHLASAKNWSQLQGAKVAFLGPRFRYDSLCNGVIVVKELSLSVLVFD